MQVASLSLAQAKLRGAVADDSAPPDVTPDPYAELRALTQDLRALCTLHERYSCRLTLDEYQVRGNHAELHVGVGTSV